MVTHLTQLELSGGDQKPTYPVSEDAFHQVLETVVLGLLLPDDLDTSRPGNAGVRITTSAGHGDILRSDTWDGELFPKGHCRIKPAIGPLVKDLLYALAWDNIPTGTTTDYSGGQADVIPIMLVLRVPETLSMHDCALARSQLLAKLHSRFGAKAVRKLFLKDGHVNTDFCVPKDYRLLEEPVKALAALRAPTSLAEVELLHERLDTLRARLAPYLN